jgi:hypothetical protein
MMKASDSTFGPYATERDTRTEPMPRQVRALHDAGLVKSGDPDRLARNTVMEHLLQACVDAGVQLGDYDRQILGWLTSTETSAAQVVIGLISRTYAAGQAAALRPGSHEKPADDGPWVAVIADEDGFVYTSYEDAAADLFESSEVEISIRRGASAEFGEDERLPGVDRSCDVAHTVECVMEPDGDDADGARFRFALAQAMAAGLNTAEQVKGASRG